MSDDGRESFANTALNDANGRESDATNGAQWMPATEAAQLLGISVRTVQKRAEAGKLLSKQEGRRLFVSVSMPLMNTEVEGEILRESFANTTLNDANGRGAEADIREPDANLLVEQLRSEIALLTEQLRAKDDQIERRDVAESELRRLMLTDKQELQTLRQKVALLIAPASEEPIPEASPASAGAQDAPEAGSSQEAPHTQQRAWWRWWPRRKKEAP